MERPDAPVNRQPAGTARRGPALGWSARRELTRKPAATGSLQVGHSQARMRTPLRAPELSVLTAQGAVADTGGGFAPGVLRNAHGEGA